MDYNLLLGKEEKKMILLGAIDDQRTKIIEYVKAADIDKAVELLEDVYSSLKEALDKNDVDSKVVEEG